MSESTYSQRYASGDSNTAGAFAFDTISSKDYAVSKLAFGAVGSVTYVSASDPLPVTVASLPLPSGAATAAKQPAIGTAGTASTDVITVQGIASMTALKVDGSAVTQPVSIASAVAVTDNSGSLTVDAPVGTPVYVRLSDGTSAISTLPVSLASVPSHAVTNAGTFAVQATVAAGASTIAKAEDVASADADVGVPAMAIRKATPANTSGTDGDYEMLQMSAGRLWVSAVVDTALPAGTNAIGKLAANTGVTIGAVEIAASQTLATVTTVTTVTTCSTVTTLTGGGVAHDGVDSGNPVKIGGRAVAGLSGATLVAAADRSDLVTGTDGALIVRGVPLEDIVSGVASITDGSSTSVIAAQGAGVKVYVTDVTIANTSATAVTVDIRDGAAGTVKWTLPVPANTSGVTHRFGSPLPFSANTAVCADPSAAASTVTVSLGGFKSKV